jgi:mRNA-degrading endonuclease RelE of RelBE toxin-antitoxin system
MPRRPKHTITFAREVLDHLDGIERKHHGTLREAIDEQLTYLPAEETRNRKPLEQPAPFGATWELRCGPENRFRVFYDVDKEERTVSILAIGIKERSRLIVGGEEYQSS